MTQILDGKAISLAIEQELKELVAQRLEAGQNDRIWPPFSWATIPQVGLTSGTR